ncbi:signal peptidase I [Chloroflexota bacterium]
MKLIGYIIGIVLTIIVGCLTFSYLTPDYNIYTVRSESMKPYLNVGDILVTGPPDGSLTGPVKPGMVITYKYNKTLLTHRVVTIDGDSIMTKGDALEEPDPQLIQTSDVIGSYLFKVPYIGYLSSFMRTKQGWFLAIILPSMLLVIWIIKDIIKESLSSA